MTDFGALTLERRDEVALITLTAGDNRFNPTSIAAWNAALDEVEADDTVAALVTTGTDKFYSNGLDLDWMGSLADDERAQSGQMITDTIRLLGRLLSFPIYTVAAINGHAFAGGAMLTLAHDARVMRTARGFWCLPEVDLGMPMAPGMAAIIQARLTPQVAHEAVLTGRRFPERLCAVQGFRRHRQAQRQGLRQLSVAQARQRVLLKHGKPVDIGGRALDLLISV